MKKLISFIIVVYALIPAGDTYCQETSNILTTATVLTRISITSKRDLDFGTDIVPGFPEVVDKTAATSGKFSLSGQVPKQISIAFILPTQLISGSNTMSITFTSTDAAYQLGTGSLVAFNPAVTKTVSFTTGGTMNIFLGGKVTPSGTQAAGNYTGAVTVNLQYTGL